MSQIDILKICLPRFLLERTLQKCICQAFHKFMFSFCWGISQWITVRVSAFDGISLCVRVLACVRVDSFGKIFMTIRQLRGGISCPGCEEISVKGKNPPCHLSILAPEMYQQKRMRKNIWPEENYEYNFSILATCFVKIMLTVNVALHIYNVATQNHALLIKLRLSPNSLKHVKETFKHCIQRNLKLSL